MRTPKVSKAPKGAEGKVSEMEPRDTKVKCAVCKNGTIVAEIGSSGTDSMNVPMGPASRNFCRPKVISFHCSNPECMVVVHHPPGRPQAEEEITTELSRQLGQRSLFN